MKSGAVCLNNMNQNTDYCTPLYYEQKDWSVIQGPMIPCVSSAQIESDLLDCITSSGYKIPKRMARLEALLMMQPGATAEFVKHRLGRIVHPVPVSTQVDPESVHEFLNAGSLMNDHDATFQDKIEFGAAQNAVHDNVKKAIEAALTEKMNNDKNLTTYKITSGIFRKICKGIQRHSVFAKYCASKQILFIQKGSVAQRLSLLSEFKEPYQVELINKHFALGGDNDCTILIDHNLPNCMDLHKALSEYLHVKMLEYVAGLSNGNIQRIAQGVKKINVSGVELEVEPCMRQHFSIKRANAETDEPEVNAVMDLSVERNGIFFSENDTLKFTDEVGRICNFTLFRYKKAFKVRVPSTPGYKILGAELLDISMPKPDSDKSRNSFHLYKSGQYTREVELF